MVIQSALQLSLRKEWVFHRPCVVCTDHVQILYSTHESNAVSWCQHPPAMPPQVLQEVPSCLGLTALHPRILWEQASKPARTEIALFTSGQTGEDLYRVLRQKWQNGSTLRIRAELSSTFA